MIEVKDVYTIEVDSKGEIVNQIKIGVAFLNTDGTLSVHLDAIPLNGKIKIGKSKVKGESNG